MLDERYFEWLLEKVELLEEPVKDLVSLAKKMYITEFTYIIDNDDNRVMDGLDLRYTMMEELNIEADQDWLELECSIFEMLVALSLRIAYLEDTRPYIWFEYMVANLGLRHINSESKLTKNMAKVEATLNRLVKREYSSTGVGGLFPLKYAPMDQRQTEIWQQMSLYLLELYRAV